MATKLSDLKSLPAAETAPTAGAAPPAAADPAADPPISAPTGTAHPVVVSFALVKRKNLWNAVVIKSRGREIIDEKLLESDDYRPVAMDAVDKASHEFWIHQVDPFYESKE